MVAGEDPAGLAGSLRALKERSGLSYGTLAKRLHVSTSTLHRYCNGDAVPLEYAPVEQFARACRATPEELVALHRSWIVADVERGRRAAAARTAAPGRAAEGARPAGGDGPSGRGPSSTAHADEGAGPGGDPEADDGPRADDRPHADDGSQPAAPVPPRPAAPAPPGDAPEGTPGPASTPATAPEDGDGDDLPGHPPGPRPARLMGRVHGRRRTAVLAGASALAVVACAGLAVGLAPGRGGGGGARPVSAQSAGAAAPQRADRRPDAHASAPSASAPPSRRAGASASAAVPPSGHAGGAPGSGADARPGGVPLTVVTRPYTWETPCSQHYLLDRSPSEVPPPPAEQDAPAWLGSLGGGVSSGGQYVELTVQGTGVETVVLQDLHVRVVSAGRPPAWTDYTMGVGCGGGVGTAAFDVDLDAGRPAAQPKAGQRHFPYKVSSSDPEVLYVDAHARAHDVRWYLELDWSSGDRRGTVRIDDHGRPFRTSGAPGRPSYEYPIGGSGWQPAAKP